MQDFDLLIQANNGRTGGDLSSPLTGKIEEQQPVIP
jgi:hypothetical protein